MTAKEAPVRIRLRGILAATATAAVGLALGYAAFGMDPDPRLVQWGVPPVLLSTAARALEALLLAVGFALAVGYLVFGSAERSARQALVALRSALDTEPPAGAGPAPRRGLEDLATGLSELAHRLRASESARREIEAAVGALAHVLENGAAESRPRQVLAAHSTGECARLAAAAAGVLEGSARLREMAGSLLSQIEDDLLAVDRPLSEAGPAILSAVVAVEAAEARLAETGAFLQQMLEQDADPPGRDQGLKSAEEALAHAARRAADARRLALECASGVARAREAETLVERELAAVRRRLLGRDVQRLSEADFVTDDDGPAGPGGGRE